MEKLNPNDPAFPHNLNFPGMTKREWMAATIMAGMMGNQIIPDVAGWDFLAEHALKATDKLIEKLNKVK